MKMGVRGRVAGKYTVGTRQRPHTDKSKAQYDELAKQVWAKLEEERKAAQQAA